jgi:phosphatidylinositol alpha-1,6-mannosyltransferase
VKKILLITTEFPPVTGGIGTYCHEIASAAARRGHDVTVFAPDFALPAEKLGDEARDERVVRYSGGAYTIRDFPRFFGQVWRELSAGSYDIVHAADWPSALIMRNVNRFRRVPYQVMVHGTEVLLAPQSRQIKLLGSRIFEMPYRITTNSNFTRNLLLENFPAVDPAKVDVTLLGVGREWFEPVPDPRPTLERLGIPADKLLLLTVARLDQRKGHRLVFRALSELAPELAARLTYAVVGKGNDDAYLAELHSLAENCPVPTIFTGAVANEDLKPLYARAHVFVMPGEPHPRRVEGFGLVYLEAAAQGVPAIASRINAIPEVVVDGTTGIVIEPGDLEALKHAIAELTQAPEERDRLGRQAQEWARGFTWDRCAEQTYEAE